MSGRILAIMSASPQRTLGVNSVKLAYEAAMERHKEMDPQGLLTPEVMRRFISAQTCPYCSRGPFKVLPGHTNKMHGIDRVELRHLAGMTTRERASSEEFTARARELAIARDFGHSEAAERGRHTKGVTNRMGEISRERIASATRNRMANTDPETKAEWARMASRAVTPAGLQRRREALQRRTLSPEHRRRLSEASQSEEANAKRAATRAARLQGHGTVASYKRGCRCEQCREAKNAPRRSGQKPGRPAKYTSEQYAEAIRLMGEGMTQRAAAASVGVTESWLSQRRASDRESPSTP